MFIVVVVGTAHITHSGYSGQLGRWVPRRSPPSRRPRPLRRWMLPRWTCSRSMPRSLSQAALLVHSQRLRWRRWRGSRSYYRFSTAWVLALSISSFGSGRVWILGSLAARVLFCSVDENWRFPVPGDPPVLEEAVAVWGSSRLLQVSALPEMPKASTIESTTLNYWFWCPVIAHAEGTVQVCFALFHTRHCITWHTSSIGAGYWTISLHQ